MARHRSITRTPKDPAGVDPARWTCRCRASGVHRAFRRLPHVPARGPGGHDDSRSQHRVPVVWPPRRPPGRGPGRRRTAPTSSTASAPACGVTPRPGAPARPRRWCSTRRVSKSSAAWTARTAATRSRASATRRCARSCATAPPPATRSSPPIRRWCPPSCGILPVGQDRVQLIPNGIDVARSGRARRSRRRTCRARPAGIADDETVFVSVGRLEANKGFADLAEALAQRRSTVAVAVGARGRWPRTPEPASAGRSLADRTTASASSAGSTTARCTPGTTPPILRASHALRRQLAGDAGGNAAPASRARDPCRRSARQSHPRSHGMADRAVVSRRPGRDAAAGRCRARTMARVRRGRTWAA